MTLGEHFREFRRRLFIAAASVLVASIVAGFYYDQVFAVPQAAVRRLPGSQPATP